MKHGTKTTYTPQEDGSIKIRKEGYFEDLNSIREETVQNVITTRDTFLSDIMKCLEVISKRESRELIIEIKTDEFYQPRLIVKQWVTHKEKIK